MAGRLAKETDDHQPANEFAHVGAHRVVRIEPAVFNFRDSLRFINSVCARLRKYDGAARRCGREVMRRALAGLIPM